MESELNFILSAALATRECRQVIAALLNRLERGKKDFGAAYHVIVCAMRHHSEEQNFEMIKTVREFLGAGVCAADLAGAEVQYSMSEFMELFCKTKKLCDDFYYPCR